MTVCRFYRDPERDAVVFEVYEDDLRDLLKRSPALRGRRFYWMLDVDPDAPDRFPAKLAVTAVNEPGTLAQIAQLIGEADGNIDNVRMVRRAPDFTEMAIDVEVRDLNHLTRIIGGLRGKSVVSKVERVFA